MVDIIPDFFTMNTASKFHSKAEAADCGFCFSFPRMFRHPWAGNGIQIQDRFCYGGFDRLQGDSGRNKIRSDAAGGQDGRDGLRQGTEKGLWPGEGRVMGRNRQKLEGRTGSGK